MENERAALDQRIAEHAAILTEIYAKRQEIGNNDLFAAVESRIIAEHLNALQRIATLPAPIVVRRGKSKWF